MVTFPFTKIAKKKPDEIAQELGQFMVDNVQEVDGFNVVKVFNLSMSDTFWKKFLCKPVKMKAFGKSPAMARKVMIEYCSPNTNKPLHLGHIRGIFCWGGLAVKLQAVGYVDS
ncbi:MAG: arginine--tRNA ligase [Saprospiraceae bacterium]